MATRFKNEPFANICETCGYMGSSGCPKADPKCDLFVAPPTNEQKLAEQLRPLIHPGWNVQLVKCTDTTNVWLKIWRIGEAGLAYNVCNVPEGTHVTTMAQHIRCYIQGLENGRKEGRESLKKDWYELMKPEDEQ